ncbi:MAG: permease [Deltaproteobacteria bacterium]|nr:permease [Deltaproteobacteria bacterium]
MSVFFIPTVEFLGHWGSVFWSTLRETAPFLVLGLLLAGILHVLVPPRIVLWALGHRGWRGAIRGSLVGLPLPLCSCGVVPTALTLRRQGASLSAMTSFTIATPETSVDALAITAALLPAIFLGVRPFAALLLAFVVGTVVEFFSTTSNEELRVNVMKLSRLMEDEHGEPAASCDDTAEICRVCGLMVTDEHEHAHRSFARIRAVFGYAFGTFFKDIASWVMIGLVLAALLQVLMPAGGIDTTWFGRYPSIQVLFAIIAGVPLYSCATATTPLAAVLLAKGLNPGAALALLLAGPATNISSMFALRRELGARITTVYYIALILCCWGLGVGFNFLWPLVQKYPELTQIANASALQWIHGIPNWAEIGASWILLVLTAHLWGRSAFHRIVHGHSEHDHGDHAGHAH